MSISIEANKSDVPLCVPKFIAFVHLLEAMCDKGLLFKNPDIKNHIFTYRGQLDAKQYGQTEGWVSESITDTAHNIMVRFRNGNTTLFDFLKEKGFEPIFDECGDFIELKETKRSGNDARSMGDSEAKS